VDSELDCDIEPGPGEFNEITPSLDETPSSENRETAEVLEAGVPPIPRKVVAEPAVVVPCDLPASLDSVANISDQGWWELSSLLNRPRSAAWLFAGARPVPIDNSSGPIIGEVFGAKWRSTSGRQTDVVIDATWPGSTLNALWLNISERVLRFRPDVAFLLLSDADARAGMSQLSRFERQLEATVTRLQRDRILPVLVTVSQDPDDDDIDQQVYLEAVVAIGKEREIAVLMPSASQSLADQLCRLLTSLHRERVGTEA
jgi:hypothetical protein